MNTHIINLTEKPFVPKGFTIKSNIKGDKVWKFDPNQIELWLSEKQKAGYQLGTELQKEIPNPFNINLLWYLLKHQELIPEEWKDKFIFFWGTILRRPHGDRSVLCLCVSGSIWGWDCGWLSSRWYANSPSAVIQINNQIHRTKIDDLYIKNIKNGCWDWQGRKNSAGYGCYGKQEKAHRVMYQLHKGFIPEGLALDHICRNKGCVNPSHLEIVTNQENVQRGESAKLTSTDVKEIRRLKESGKLNKDIGKVFGVTESTISRVINYKMWDNI